VTHGHPPAAHPWISDALDRFFAKTEATPPVRLKTVLQEIEKRSIPYAPANTSQQFLGEQAKRGQKGLQEAYHGKLAMTLSWGPNASLQGTPGGRMCGRFVLQQRQIYPKHGSKLKVASMFAVRHLLLACESWCAAWVGC
jgi:hypothetical protein